nr:DNA-directed RNA polymerases IV and V subunit 4 [Ipomoea batatas]GME17469.1 DNA-directed RNA polymerases IV and V subunit 4 [Ipomoea batatas]
MPEMGGKSSLKSPASSNGKDDSSVSNKGRKVQFDSDSLDGNLSKSNGKASGSVGKGGKGGKGSSGKGQTSKAPLPLELRVEQEISENTKCLMDCEAAEILQGIHDQMTILSEDPAIKLPTSFDKGLMYAMRHKLYENYETVKQVLKPLKEHGVADSEMCMIANFHPESTDEVFALVPSLKGKKNKLQEPLKNVLEELAKLKSSS